MSRSPSPSSTRPFRLLQLLGSTGIGGMEEHALSVARGALERGWSVDVAFPERDATAELRAAYRAAGTTAHACELADRPAAGRPVKLLRWGAQARDIRGLLKRLKPDAVQLNLPSPTRLPGVLLALAASGLPTEVVFHLVTPFITHPAWRPLYHLACSRKQRWVAVSAHNRRLLADGFDVDVHDITVILNSAAVPDDAVLEAARETRSALLHAYKLDPARPLWLTAGRLHPQKGYDLLLDVLPELVATQPALQCLWLGEGPERAALVAGLAERELTQTVTLLDRVPHADLLGLLRAADLFVLPSRYEGSPLVVAEALANGVAVVATRASGIPEQIEHGREGLLSEVDDREGLLENLRFTLAEPEALQSMGRAGRARMQAYRLEDMVTRHLDLLADVKDIGSVAATKKPAG